MIAEASSVSITQDRALVGGKWLGSKSGAEIQVRNPATDEVLATVPRCGKEDIEIAVNVAHNAQPSWAALPAIERGRILRRLYELMMRDQNRLGLLMTLEQGKPLAEAKGEVAYAAGFIVWSSEESKRIYGETVQAFSAQKRVLVLKQAAGVAAAITPWNFPAAMITRKMGPALAAGCSMVAKPASQTPLMAIAIGELAVEAGVPDGVLNIVPGDAVEIADALLGDSRVRVFSFTGSTEVGKELMRKASQHVNPGYPMS